MIAAPVDCCCTGILSKWIICKCYLINAKVLANIIITRQSCVNKFVQWNWITFIICCDQIAPQSTWKQLEYCLRLFCFCFFVSFFFVLLIVTLSIIWLCCMFALCCRWCTMEKSSTIHSEYLIIAISYFGLSTWMHQFSSWTCPLVMLVFCAARDHRCLACVSMMHRVSKVGCFSFNVPLSAFELLLP